MAVLKGNSGAVSWAGTAIANIKNWSLNGDFGSADTTEFGVSDTTSVQLLRTTTGQISGDLSTDAQQNTIITQMGNTGTLADAAVVFTGSAVAGQKKKWTASAAQLSNVSLGAEVAGVQSFSASVNCSGGVAYSTS
ncbi:MAG: hypothetical protein IMZ61_04685 [Planctomycetes bacterium]|nr:hypothetical protein [Planctomycetota bacterium]